MGITAAVIHAGLGDLSLGLNMAGIRVIAAYEADERAADLHRSNLDVPVYPLSLEQVDPARVPKVDLLAVRLNWSASLRAQRREKAGQLPFLGQLQELLTGCSPSAFLLLLNAGAARAKELWAGLHEITRDKYQYAWRAVDVAQTTGFPVNERDVVVVGWRSGAGRSFRFPGPETVGLQPLERYLQSKEAVDPWYFRIALSEPPRHRQGQRVFCWEGDAYAGADLVRWNYIKPPLVDDAGRLRRITHREVANLKGFPAGYTLPARGHSWLYQKLMYAGNVTVLHRLAREICRMLEDKPWRSALIEPALRFEQLFGRYLRCLAGQDAVRRHFRVGERLIDFCVGQGETAVYFELKYYRGRSLPELKLQQLCQRLPPPAAGTMVLVLANEVEESRKSACWERFHVRVWDVANLLWLFEDAAEIKREFIAFLDYAPGEITPGPPQADVFGRRAQGQKEREETECREEQDEARRWEDRLRQIQPGEDQAREYEKVCTEILEYALGDYLTLWKDQESSNDGLYRFDLCCKVKNDAKGEFFSTVRDYFNTKYILFEFKNYTQQITQKEIYTTEKYLYGTALRKVAILISRKGADEHAQQAAKGCLRENGKLILCLSDQEMLEMADIKLAGRSPDEFLATILDELLIHLEK